MQRNNHRIKNILEMMQEKSLDGLLFSSPANITYLTGYPSRDSYLLISPKENIYFTDSRYTEEAKLYLKGMVSVAKLNGSFFKAIAGSCLDLKLKHVGFEERNLPFAEYNRIQERLNKKSRLIPVYGLAEELRRVKDLRELKNIRKSLQITMQALEFAADFIRPGIKEIEVVGELERFIRYHGAGNNAFDIIVASGPNSSYPHHIPGQREIGINEPVLVDIGTDHLGYKSDLTRVFFLGKIKVLLRRIYDVVLEANYLAINKIAPGVPIKEVDLAARQYIAKKGYAANFGHALGHSIGLEVHEAPHISGNEEAVLEEGMVFTVEPAVYLPRKFGIRIEDMILVKKKGCEVLSGSLNK